MKILLAVDGSACSEKAVNFVVNSMDWYAQPPEITLITVDEIGLGAERARATLGNEAVENYYREQRKNSLEPAEKILRGKNVTYKTIYAAGDVAGQIKAHAEECKADLIVMGSRGHGGIAGIVMGSVATKVLATSKIPIIVIR